MGALEPEAKDAFARSAASQNVGRLLLNVVWQILALINAPDLVNSAAAGGGPDFRTAFWVASREARELLSKALAALVVASQWSSQLDAILQYIGELLDVRESLRRRGMEFVQVHWAPVGTAPAPQPPYAVDVAVDILLTSNGYSRMPAMLLDLVKQTGLSDPSVVLKLQERERADLDLRVEDELLAMWLLSHCPKSVTRLHIQNGKFVFEVPNEFSVSAIYDMNRCQILEAEIRLPGARYLKIPAEANLGFANILRQAIGLLEAKHIFSLDLIKRAYRKAAREMVHLQQVRRETMVEQFTLHQANASASPSDTNMTAENENPRNETGETAVNTDQNAIPDGAIEVTGQLSDGPGDHNVPLIDDAMGQTDVLETTEGDDLQQARLNLLSCLKKPVLSVKQKLENITQDIADLDAKIVVCEQEMQRLLGLLRSLLSFEFSFTAAADLSVDGPDVSQKEHNLLVNRSNIAPSLGVQSDVQSQSIQSHSTTTTTAKRFQPRRQQQTLLMKSGASAADALALQGIPDYFAEIYILGRWTVGGVFLSQLRDQVLRARIHPRVYPGGVHRYRQLGAADILGREETVKSTSETADHGANASVGLSGPGAVDTDSVTAVVDGPLPEISSKPAFRALDVYLLAKYDYTIGGVLIRLLQFILKQSNSLLPFDLISMLSVDDLAAAATRPGIPHLVSSQVGLEPEYMSAGGRSNDPNQTLCPTAGRKPVKKLIGSGAILRFRLDRSTGLWSVILWPLTPILWLLENAAFIRGSRGTEGSPDEIVLESHLAKAFGLDYWEYVRDLMSTDHSVNFLRTFSAAELELSQWTRHALSALSTMTLGCLASLLRSRANNHHVAPTSINLQCPSGGQTAHRSLKVNYFDRYTVFVRIASFDGTLRLSFKETGSMLVSSRDTWLRVPGTLISLESDVSSAVRDSASGVRFLLILMPYLKFFAFVDIIRNLFVDKGLTEVKNNFERRTFQKNTESKTGIPDLFDSNEHVTHALEKYVWEVVKEHYPSLENEAPADFERIDIVPTPESGELLTVLQNLQHLMVQSSENAWLQTELTFMVEEFDSNGGVVRVILSVTINNSFALTECNLIVARRVQDDKWTVVARLPVAHPGIPGSDATTTGSASTEPDLSFSESHPIALEMFETLWIEVQKTLAAAATRLSQIVSIAGLTAEQFPFTIQDLLPVTRQDCFSFWCAPSKGGVDSDADPNWAQLAFSWDLDRIVTADILR